MQSVQILQGVCGENGRGKEATQWWECGCFLMPLFKQDQEGFSKVRAASHCPTVLCSHDSWFDCSVLSSFPPFQVFSHIISREMSCMTPVSLSGHGERRMVCAAH